MFRTNLFIALLTLFVSCDFLYKEHEKREMFKGELLKELSFEHNFKLNKSYLGKDEITRPVGTWVRLIETEGGCIDYKIPSKLSVGELVISSKVLKCQDMPVSIKKSYLKNISNLKIKLTNDTIRGKKIRNENFGFSISYKHFKKDISFKIRTFNINRNNYFEKKKFKKYDSHSTHRWKDGLRVLNSSRLKTRSTPWPAPSKDDIINNKINFCYRVDNQCNVILKNHCNECLNGWVDVVDFNCLNSGGSRACAPLVCGTRGMPACPRGSFWKGLEMTDLCFSDSDAGYCEKGLKTICDENKILTCI